MSPKTGKVYLVGAGPGDPLLITVRGLQLLEQADLVLYDYLVNPVVLGQAGLLDGHHPSRELVCLGHHGSGRLLQPAEITARMIAAAQAGQVVVRLKGGDPAIFGRTAEEIAALEEAGVEYEIVPGVTAGLAASSYAGIPLTHREQASCVALVTGQECQEKCGETLDYANLARFPGTLVFYMGVTTAPHWSAELMSHGKSPETPVAIVRRATLPDQQVITTTLAAVGDVTRSLRPPAVIIVGEVVKHAFHTDWFTPAVQRAGKPLFGQSVLVTRPEHQAGDMIAHLQGLGANTLFQPAIKIAPPTDWTPVDQAIQDLIHTDWLVFSSANGVSYFLDRLFSLGLDIRHLKACSLAAIGPATCEALAAYHLHADLEPGEYRAESLAESLIPLAAGRRVLLVRASRGREVLAEILTAAGAQVLQVVAYRSEDVSEPRQPILAALQAGKIDWITVTSSAIARSLIRLFGEDLKRARLAAISPLTTEVLESAGYQVAATASEYTTAGLLAAMLE